jgi:hypothetical protein
MKICPEWGTSGSILGPLLFIIFINNIDLGLKNRIVKFADDTKVLGKVGTEKEIVSLRNDLQRLFDWSETWQMKFNIDKCKVIHGENKNKRAKYTIEGKELASTEDEKDLGGRGVILRIIKRPFSVLKQEPKVIKYWV